MKRNYRALVREVKRMYDNDPDRLRLSVRQYQESEKQQLIKNSQ
jgi:hypothetical protein